MENMKIWNALKQPPKSALKTIKGGRLKGMTDINPQYRYQIMTELFGPCGVGWKYEITKLWLESGVEPLVCAFATINLYVKDDDKWCDPIPGIGGSMLVAKESGGPYVSDEAYKMAVTDALSVAMKMLGVAADIYAGLWDGSKYRDAKGTKPEDKQSEGKTDPEEMSKKEWDIIKSIGNKEHELTEKEVIEIIKWVAEKEGISPRHLKMSKLLLPAENFEKVFTEFCEFKMDESANDIPYVDPQTGDPY